MKENIKKNKKKYIIYSVVLLIIFALSIGFSAFQTQLLIDDSIFNVRLQIDTRVSGSVVSKTGGDAVSNYEDYNVSKIYGSASFPSASSYVLYKVDLTNYGNIKTGLLNITSNTSGINYQVCDSNGSNCSNNPRTAVCSGNNCTLGSTKAIYVKVTSNTTGTKNIDLDLDFEPYHNITYENFMENTSSFDTEMMENDSYELTFNSDVEEVSLSGNAIINYNKTTNKLIISNPSTDITISAKYLLTDVADTSYSGSNPNNYVRYNDTLYRIVTKENVDDGYGNTELRAKIISNTSLGNNQFDSTTNEYAESSLKDLLNETYYTSLSTEAKELIETASWTEEYAGFVGLINTTNYSSNSTWIPNEGYTITKAEDDKINAITSGGLVASLPSVSRATYPSLYLKQDVLIVGGTGTSTNPYLLELSDGGLQSNPTIIRGRSLTVTGSNQELVTVSSKMGTPYYSTSTQLNSSNYTSGSTSIPQAKNVGTYYIYYYIPAGENYKAKSGRVKTTIAGITYTINYTKGNNISEIGKTHDSCTTSGSTLSCSVTLPTITPYSGWENGKWSDGTNEYNPNSSFTLNASNSGLTLNSSVSGKTYVATFYFNSNTTLGELTVDTRSVSCTVQENNSCTVSVPSAVSASIGKYNSAYKGVSRTAGNLTSGSLELTGNQDFYAYYSSNVTYYHYGTNDYVTDTIYRNEYFTNSSNMSAILASTNTGTVSVSLDSGPGSSEYVGLSTTADTTVEYSTMSMAAGSNVNKLYTVYEFNVSYQKGANVSAIGKNTDSCKVVYNDTTCNVTLPTITANVGYTSVGWSITNGDTTGVTGSYAIYINDLVLYGNAKGNEYTATFYYNSNTTNGQLTISTKTATCTVTSGTSCTVTVPTEVTNSVGKYNSAYKGVSINTSSMDESELSISNNTDFYAMYSTPVTRYFYSSGYKSGTIYRNEYFTSNSTMNSVLNTIDNGTTNYTTAKGPSSSNWLGLSTAQDTTPEYNTVQEAANSNSTTLYTVYQFVINYQAGSNVSAVGASSATCEVTTSDTSCAVMLPSITPNTGFISVGWSLSNGDTTGTAAGSMYIVSNNNRVMYANAIGANYINTTTNEGYSTLNDAFSAVSNNQTIKVLQNTTESTQATLANTKTGITLDLNGKTITSTSEIINNGVLTINGTGGKITSSSYVIRNNGTLTISGTAELNGTASNVSTVLNDGILTISGGSITSTNYRSIYNGYTASTARVILSSGSITSRSYGIYNEKGKSNTTSAPAISITGGTITSNEAAGIYNKADGMIYMTGGSISGSTNGIYNIVDANNTNGIINITGGTITSSAGTGLNLYTGTANISGNASITGYTYGIAIYSGSVSNGSGGTISVKGVANITSGTISATNAIGIYVAGGTLTLGSNNETVSQTSPSIIGTTFGVNTAGTSTFNFYDGIVKSNGGTGKSINGTVSDTPTGYVVYKSTTNGVESAILIQPNYQNTSTNEYYLTLEDAFNSVSNNETIKTLRDMTETLETTGDDIVTLDSAKTGIKLDLNGKTITMDNAHICNYGTLEIYNSSNIDGKIQGGDNQTIENRGTLTINGTSSTNKVIIHKNINGGINGAIFNVSSLTINDNVEVIETLNNYDAIINWGTATINGGTITGPSDGIDNSRNGVLYINGTNTHITGTTGSGIENKGTLTINNGTITGGINGLRNTSTATITGGTISGDSNGIFNYYYTYSGTTIYGNTTITGGSITGGNYGASIGNNTTLTLGIENSTVSTTSPIIQTTSTEGKYGLSIGSGCTVNFYDGIIKSASGTGYSIYGNITNIQSGYKVQKTTTDGIENAILVEIDKNYQNTTTNIYYETLKDAFSAVLNNQTIKVLQDTTESVVPTLASDKTGIKLDLNGKTITSSANITNSGELDIYNSSSTNGTISRNSNPAITNNGTLTINGTSSTNTTIISNSSGYGIRNNASSTLTVNNNSQITSTSSVGVYNNGTATLAGGSISGTVGINNNTTGVLSINSSNVQVTGTSTYGLQNTGTATISNGTITGTTIGLYNNSSTSSGVTYDGDATITGGTITGATRGININNGTVTLGIKNSSVSTSTPLIQATNTSNAYGVYIGSNGTFNFYDGILKSASGSGKSIYGTVSDIPDDYSIFKETTSGVESAYLYLPLVPTISLSAKESTYSGSPIAANTATATYGGNSITLSYTYKYYTNSTCTTGETTTAPTAAGQYYVKAISAATGNYVSASSSCVSHKINKYTPSISLSATSGSIVANNSSTFTATPTTISYCQGTLTAASANTSYVTITGGASNSNVPSGTAKTITYKGVAATSGTNINVNYVPTDTANCNSASTKTYSVTVSAAHWYNGSTYYNTLASAVSAAATNDTIYAYNTHTDNSTVTIDKNINIDTNGKTITRSSAIRVNSGKYVAVQGTGTLYTSTALPLVENFGTLYVYRLSLVNEGGLNGIINHGTVYVGADDNDSSNDNVPIIRGTKNGIWSDGGTIVVYTGYIYSTQDVVVGDANTYANDAITAHDTQVYIGGSGNSNTYPNISGKSVGIALYGTSYANIKRGYVAGAKWEGILHDSTNTLAIGLNTSSATSNSPYINGNTYGIASCNTGNAYINSGTVDGNTYSAVITQNSTALLTHGVSGFISTIPNLPHGVAVPNSNQFYYLSGTYNGLYIVNIQKGY